MSRRSARSSGVVPPVETVATPPPAPVAITAATAVTTPARLGDATLVVDPGAYTIKAGFAPSSPEGQYKCHVMPNCLAKSSRDDKTYIASQLSTCTDFGEMQFKRPVQKGYIVNWPTEAAIWEHEFFASNATLACDPHETNLVLAEAPNAPTALQRNTDEIVFEHFEFAAAYRTTSTVLNAYNDTRALFNDPPHAQSARVQPAEHLLLIDTGYSHTTVTPLIRARPIHPASRRMTFGGKHLSNYLAQLISLRHFSLIDEPYIVDQIKEDTCFVSDDFARDLDNTWKGAIGDAPRNNKDQDTTIRVDYVLPDYERHHRGFTRPHDASRAARLAKLGLLADADDDNDQQAGISTVREEAFPLANERFTVPELLFNPTDVGMRESGIPDTIMQCLETLPTKQLWQAFLGNIVVVGGSSLIRGFVERLEAEVRIRVPDDFVVRVRRADDPIKSTWTGGARLASDRSLIDKVLVTKQDYDEYGAAWVARQYATRRIGDE
ncbi:hypothetical protein AAFC00_005965 [Neodothiora populina]|uniref:Actin-related protein 6 n=1 Tax=Neodothiora populina TaxID=2781224 RepID=A0ABR3P6L5_9PEZI